MKKLVDFNLNYRVAVGRYMDETSKLFKFEQSWLVYNEVENEANAFLQPYLSIHMTALSISMQLKITSSHIILNLRFV